MYYPSIPKHRVERFRQIYKERYGEELTYEEARDRFDWVMRFVRAGLGISYDYEPIRLDP